MASDRDKEIYQVFMDALDDFGDDKSTEFLIQYTSDVCLCSYSRVVDALERAAETKGGDNGV